MAQLPETKKCIYCGKEIVRAPEQKDSSWLRKKKCGDCIRKHKHDYGHRRYLELRDKLLAKTKQYYQQHKEEAKEYRQKYWSEHREYLLKKQKEYRDTHRPQETARNKVYRDTHRDRFRAYRRDYYQRNKERLRTYYRDYYKNNKDIIKLRNLEIYYKKRAGKNKQKNKVENPIT